jgi:osmotically inducible protein OsmC
MFERSANAVWEGTLAEGKGVMKMAGYEGPYSVPSRFENGEGTNPETLIAAAHAGCFSMAFSGGLTRAGFKPNSISTTANVKLEKLEEGWRITAIELVTEGDVPGIDDAEFQELALAAKKGCPISNALAAVPDISVQATLL